METMNPRVVQMEYAVRGKTPLEAAKIEEAMKRVRKKVVDGVFAFGGVWLAYRVGLRYVRRCTLLTYVRHSFALPAVPNRKKF